VSRRLGAVGVIMLALFIVLAAQVAYLQFWHANALAKSELNPRVQNATLYLPRGDIVAADGTVLAHSVPSGDPFNPWRRIYPDGSLTAGVVGFDSSYYGAWGLEAYYNDYLIAHKQPPATWKDLLSPKFASDTVQLTLLPALQKVAQNALAGRDGAVVVLDPRNGSVLSMYSNPTYNDNVIATTSIPAQIAAWKAYNTPDVHNFTPLAQLATQWSFPPGSTFKVVTSSAVFSSDPVLLNKQYPQTVCFVPPNGNPQKPLCNDSYARCGGTVQAMLPPSCDTGFAMVGGDLGGTLLSAQANKFGFNEVIPIDLYGTAVSYFPSPLTLANDIPQLEYSAIGQENVRATALQNALVAAGIANGGVVMTPHLMSEIIGPNDLVLKKYEATPWLTAILPSDAAPINQMMQNVVAYGTASGIFSPADNVAAKTGTAQTGTLNPLTDDWMIAFAPANHPTVAVAVVLPFQPKYNYGATIAGPVVKCMIEGTLAVQNGQPASGTPTTCPK